MVILCTDTSFSVHLLLSWGLSKLVSYDVNTHSKWTLWSQSICIAGSTSSPTVLRRWKLNCWKTTTTVHDLRRDVHLGKGIQSTLHVVVVIAVKALHKCLENLGPVLAIALLHHCTNNNGNCSSHLSIRCTQAWHQFSLDVLLIP